MNPVELLREQDLYNLLSGVAEIMRAKDDADKEHRYCKLREFIDKSGNQTLANHEELWNHIYNITTR